MSKSLVEKIREMIDISIDREWHPTSCSESMIGRSVISQEDERELFTVIADRIENEYMELPMLDGKPLNVGDKVDCLNGEIAEVYAIMNNETVVLNCISKSYPLTPWDVCDLKRHNQQEIDTLERIEEDARKAYKDYWECCGVGCRDCPDIVDGKNPRERYGANTCFNAQSIDLLRRQREMLEKRRA